MRGAARRRPARVDGRGQAAPSCAACVRTAVGADSGIPLPVRFAKLAAADEPRSGDTLQPDLRRTREPLESFPLDSLRLIGSLRRGHDAVALIEADKLVYPLRVGAHLGQDFGKIIAIGEKTVDIEEMVPESGGRWAQRRAQLVLQEKK